MLSNEEVLPPPASWKVPLTKRERAEVSDINTRLERVRSVIGGLMRRRNYIMKCAENRQTPRPKFTRQPKFI